MTECCLLVCFRPSSAARIINGIYPKTMDNDDLPSMTPVKINRLLEYVADYPKKIPYVLNILDRRIRSDLRHNNIGYVKVGIEAMSTLIGNIGREVVLRVIIVEISQLVLLLLSSHEIAPKMCHRKPMSPAVHNSAYLALASDLFSTLSHMKECIRFDYFLPLIVRRCCENIPAYRSTTDFSESHSVQAAHYVAVSEQSDNSVLAMLPLFSILTTALKQMRALGNCQGVLVALLDPNSEPKLSCTETKEEDKCTAKASRVISDDQILVTNLAWECLDIVVSCLQVPELLAQFLHALWITLDHYVPSDSSKHTGWCLVGHVVAVVQRIDKAYFATSGVRSSLMSHFLQYVCTTHFSTAVGCHQTGSPSSFPEHLTKGQQAPPQPGSEVFLRLLPSRCTRLQRMLAVVHCLWQQQLRKIIFSSSEETKDDPENDSGVLSDSWSYSTERNIGYLLEILFFCVTSGLGGRVPDNLMPSHEIMTKCSVLQPHNSSNRALSCGTVSGMDKNVGNVAILVWQCISSMGELLVMRQDSSGISTSASVLQYCSYMLQCLEKFETRLPVYQFSSPSDTCMSSIQSVRIYILRSIGLMLSPLLSSPSLSKATKPSGTELIGYKSSAEVTSFATNTLCHIIILIQSVDWWVTKETICILLYLVRIPGPSVLTKLQLRLVRDCIFNTLCCSYNYQALKVTTMWELQEALLCVYGVEELIESIPIILALDEFCQVFPSLVNVSENGSNIGASSSADRYAAGALQTPTKNTPPLSYNPDDEVRESSERDSLVAAEDPVVSGTSDPPEEDAHRSTELLCYIRTFILAYFEYVGDFLFPISSHEFKTVTARKAGNIQKSSNLLHQFSQTLRHKWMKEASDETLGHVLPSFMCQKLYQHVHTEGTIKSALGLRAGDELRCYCNDPVSFGTTLEPNASMATPMKGSGPFGISSSAAVTNSRRFLRRSIHNNIMNHNIASKEESPKPAAVPLSTVNNTSSSPSSLARQELLKALLQCSSTDMSRFPKYTEDIRKAFAFQYLPQDNVFTRVDQQCAQQAEKFCWGIESSNF